MLNISSQFEYTHMAALDDFARAGKALGLDGKDLREFIRDQQQLARDKRAEKRGDEASS